LQKLAGRQGVVSLAIRIAEQRLSPGRLAAWRRQHEEFEDFLAELLERHCDCECPRQVAQLFLLLAIDVRSGSFALQLIDPPRIESAVDLILPAYPGGTVQCNEDCWNDDHDATPTPFPLGWSQHGCGPRRSSLRPRRKANTGQCIGYPPAWSLPPCAAMNMATADRQ
jgi:hypothetical protein